MMQNSDVLFEQKGNVGHIIINRPQALNALNFNVIEGMRVQLEKWKDDKSISVVVVRGEGGKAFCAGGDVKAVYADGLERKLHHKDNNLTYDFFYKEYSLNYMISQFPKPYVSLLDGIVMGGGVGVSVHGSHRIVTEHTMFAMPETGIGLFPDVGVVHFLSRCKDNIGLFLGLTGQRLKAADCMAIGFGTHFIKHVDVSTFISELERGEKLDTVLEKLKAKPEEDGFLKNAIDEIKFHFEHKTIEGIFESLSSAKTPWADEILERLYGLSPTSLKVTFKHIKESGKASLKDILITDFRLSQACMAGHDFYEGIRALLIDKDKNPKWMPETIINVPEHLVEQYFASLGEKDLQLP